MSVHVHCATFTCTNCTAKQCKMDNHCKVKFCLHLYMYCIAGNFCCVLIFVRFIGQNFERKFQAKKI